MNDEPAGDRRVGHAQGRSCILAEPRRHRPATGIGGRGIGCKSNPVLPAVPERAVGTRYLRGLTKDGHADSVLPDGRRRGGGATLDGLWPDAPLERPAQGHRPQAFRAPGAVPRGGGRRPADGDRHGRLRRAPGLGELPGGGAGVPRPIGRPPADAGGRAAADRTGLPQAQPAGAAWQRRRAGVLSRAGLCRGRRGRPGQAADRGRPRRMARPR
ncbi:MAG: hypothetical protein JWQ88_3050 [Rhodoferax sp.]|nr:hypothetical protein [Rhodoferax sp.]